MEETLNDMMKKVLADTFAMYLKTHNFHWNVEGSNFPQYHEFFGKLYLELFSSIDNIAEQIRGLDAYAPGSFSRFKELTDVEDELTVPDGIEMAKILGEDNEVVMASLSMALKLATEFDKQGLVNFLANRIDAHSTHRWMLRSIIK